MKQVIIRDQDIWDNLNTGLFTNLDEALQNRVENLLLEQGFDMNQEIRIEGSLKYSDYIICTQE